MPRVTENLLYKSTKSGEIAGSITSTRMTGVECNAVMFTASSGNSGNVYIGGPGVTIPDGTSDNTSGVELQPGDALQLIPCGNLSVFYYICDNAGDDIVYLAMA